ncbi:hypothetical protein JTE90_026615 [Oedothorax gibbosus]|uniref:Uncharacterized protein n=1 Tax=Oedothorax gibbosus TaxID=931172 RepID=A0AAV6V1X1_9ARAC|nr:hypothetical protein JTE90_026615 [Oedothorax gibbosus]
MSSSFLLLLGFVAAVAIAGPAVPVIIPANQAAAYEFGYEFGDGLGMTQHRREVADGLGNVKGGFGYMDPLGVYRNVEYTAGAEGYKPVIRSNEPGLTSHVSGNAVYYVDLPPPAAIAQGLLKFRV